MMKFIYQLNDALRMFFRAQKKHLIGFYRYSGSVEEISIKIIENSFNKKKRYYQVSSGHFCQFYARDFGMVCQSLINIGYKKEVKETLSYAMKAYESSGNITTQISPRGVPFNFPNHTPESAAYMLHSLIILDDKLLLEKYSSFFKKIAKNIYEQDIEKETGLLRKDKHFSSMKDHSLRTSSCYSNSMLGMFSNDLKKAKIPSELTKFDYNKILISYFWKKDHFIEDLSGKNIVSSDANVFPFWTGVVSDKEKAKKAIKSIQKKNLDKPWPLKYTSKEDVPKKLHFADIFAYGYEHDTIWMHLGMCYLKVLNMYDKKTLHKHLDQYARLIKEHKNFLEVYFANKKPFKRFGYVCDESMIWVAGFLDLYKKKFFNSLTT